MEKDIILQMQKVNKTFDKVCALSNVDFELKHNEILGLLGGNGAGKTTLMNTLYGLYKMDSGKVIMDGKTITILSPKDAIQPRHWHGPSTFSSDQQLHRSRKYHSRFKGFSSPELKL